MPEDVIHEIIRLDNSFGTLIPNNQRLFQGPILLTYNEVDIFSSC